MKKQLIFTLACAALLGLSGCGNTPVSSSSAKASSQTSSSQTTSKATSSSQGGTSSQGGSSSTEGSSSTKIESSSVSAKAVTAIAVTAADSKTSIAVEGTVQLTAAVTPTDADDAAVVWSTSDADIATVSEAGLVTGVSDGVVTITATAHDGSGVTGTIELTITATNLVAYSGIVTDAKTVCSFKGTVAVVGGKYTLISDGTNSVIAYNATGVSKGEYVLAYGTWTTYGNAVETKTVKIVKDKTGTAPSVPSTASAKTAAEMDAYFAAAVTASPCGTYVSVPEAQLYASGSYTDMRIHGSTAVVNPIAADGFTLPDVNIWGTVNAWIACYKGTLAYLIIDGFTADATQVDAATSVTVSSLDNVTSIETGVSLQFSAVVAPFKADQSVTWSVANKDTTVTTALATIDASGKLTAVGAGVVVVTATSSTAGIAGTFELTITAPSVNYTSLLAYTYAGSGTGDGSASLSTDATLTALQGGAPEGTATTAQIITAVTEAVKFRQGRTGRGYLFGSSGTVGSLKSTLTSASEIHKIRLTVLSYSTSKNSGVLINDQTEAVPFTGTTTLTYTSDAAITNFNLTGTIPTGGEARFYLLGVEFFKIA